MSIKVDLYPFHPEQYEVESKFTRLFDTLDNWHYVRDNVLRWSYLAIVVKAVDGDVETVLDSECQGNLVSRD